MCESIKRISTGSTASRCWLVLSIAFATFVSTGKTLGAPDVAPPGKQASRAVKTDPELAPARAVESQPAKRKPAQRKSGDGPPVKTLLTAKNFHYLGCFLEPVEVGGYTWGGLTLRKRADGTKTFFVFGNRAQPPGVPLDPVLEISLPISLGADPENAPRASLVKDWGFELYTDHRRLQVETKPKQINSESLLWANDRLYVSFGHYYAVQATSYPCLMFSELSDAGAKSFGPWFTTIHSQLTRDYMVSIPEWFAKAYTNGKSLGMGSGQRSGAAACSFGPCLVAVAWPERTTTNMTKLAATPLVQYPMQHRCPRDADYLPRGEFMALPPRNGTGLWTSHDLVDACSWIDLPERHGVLFFGRLAQGNIWYGDDPDPKTGIDDPASNSRGEHAERYARRWWIYDPADLAKVASENMESWAIRPVECFDPGQMAPNVNGDCTGAAFDASTSTLYVCYPQTEKPDFPGAGRRPVVHAWRVN